MGLRGMMMEQPLLISSLIDYAAAQYGEVEIVSRSVEGPIHRATYAEVARRSRQLAQAVAFDGAIYRQDIAWREVARAGAA